MGLCKVTDLNACANFKCATVFNGFITGAGALAKTGTAVLTLTGANDFSDNWKWYILGNYRKTAAASNCLCHSSTRNCSHVCNN